MFICLNVFLIFVTMIFSFLSKFFIDKMCGVALAPAARTISGATFHPLDVMLLMSGCYFVVFLARVFVANLSLHYVNSINCIVTYGVGAFGKGWLYGWPMTHIMSGLSLILQ
jgi:hypothetical protein